MSWSFEVPMIDGSRYKLNRLLARGTDNFKTNKSETSGQEIITKSLSLAPSKASGFNLCTSASAGCIKGCIFKSGNGLLFPRTVLPPRIAKSRLLRLYPNVFISRLLTELNWFEKLAKRKNLRPLCRLNVFSNVKWWQEFPQIFTEYPDIQFYDYTKHFDEMMLFLEHRHNPNNGFPANLHLTFSRSENNWDACLKVLYAGGNVAVPFHVSQSNRWNSAKPLPKYFEGFRVFDGDLTDLRPLDRQGIGDIIGLRAKGKGKTDRKSGFIIDLQTYQTGMGV